MAENNEQKMQEDLEAAQLIKAKIVEAMTPAIEAFMVFCKELGRTLSVVSETWQRVASSEQWEFILAYAWACTAKPEWVCRLNHTKKKRTRKKYQDRILRAYRKARGV